MWTKVDNETEKNIILLLSNNPGKSSLTELAKKLSLSKTAILKQIKKLEKKGIVEYKAYHLIGQRSEIRLIKKNVKIRQEYDFKEDVISEIGLIILFGVLSSVLFYFLTMDLNVIISSLIFSLIILIKTFYNIITSPIYTNVYVNIPKNLLTKLTEGKNGVDNGHKPAL